VIQVNIRAALATVCALVPAMRRRGAGQIALVSSIAAWHGVPLTPAYSASKAALKAYGEALRGALAPAGIEVNVVLPGFVRTAMSDKFPGPKLFMLSAEDAARRIVRGLARDRARISFPLLPSLFMRSLALLPAAAAQRILRSMGYGG
jgi:short-subunit dehydrogenase